MQNVDQAESGSHRIWITQNLESFKVFPCVLDKVICLISLSIDSWKGEKWIRNGKVVNIEVLPFACYKPMSSVIFHVNKAFLFYYNYSNK